MEVKSIVKNWVKGTIPSVLESIHQKGINITIHNREVNMLEKETNALLKQGAEFTASGEVTTILNEISKGFLQNEYPLLLKDIENLLRLFKKITGAEKFQLLLAIIDTNMCRKFHTDVNDLRMLCTYVGAGTLWLTDDNINRKELNAYGNNKSIVLDENKIQQAETGSVLILKGSNYLPNNTAAVVHRSLTIEGNGEKRLLLRIDTNEFLKYVDY